MTKVTHLLPGITRDHTPLARAVIHLPYASRDGQTYLAMLLCRGRNGKYFLPKGDIKGHANQRPINALCSELPEYLNLYLNITTSGELPVATIDDKGRPNEIYIVDAFGDLEVNKPDEIRGIGFYNPDWHNRIPDNRLEDHVKALLRLPHAEIIDRLRIISNDINIHDRYIEQWRAQIEQIRK